MAETPIEWAWPPGYKGATWNPVDGCWPVSPGCAHCYAATMARRIVLMGGPASERYRLRVVHKDGEPVAKWNGTFGEVPQLLDLPLRTKVPTCFFVNSMSDLFGEGVSDGYIAAVFGVMAACPHHRFIVLTKRAERLPRWYEWVAAQRAVHTGAPIAPLDVCATLLELLAVDWERIPKGLTSQPAAWPLPNVWLGVSVEDQQRADERIPHLLRVPAAVRFLSCEPLLGPLVLQGGNVPDSPDGPWPAPGQRMFSNRYLRGQTGDRRIDWVIVGGESGPGARPMHPGWARSLRDQCAMAGVPFFFKQWGHHAPWVDESRFTRGGAEKLHHVWLTPDGRSGDCWIIDDDGGWSNWTGEPPEDMSQVAVMAPVGKKAAGALLDGRMHREWPRAA